MSHFMGCDMSNSSKAFFYMLSDLSDACVDLSIALKKWESTIAQEPGPGNADSKTLSNSPQKKDEE